MKLSFLLLNSVSNFPPPPTPPPPGFPVDNLVYLISFAIVTSYLAFIKLKKNNFQ
jgi:hypothetical protein